MGCLINWDKLELTPTQQLNFVGIHFDLLEDTVQPATEKMYRLLTKVSPFLHNQSVPAQAWEILQGLLNQLEAYVPWRKIHVRQAKPPPPVIQSTERSQQPSNPSIEGNQRRNPEVDRENFFKGCPIHQPTYQYRICSEGMGCTYGLMQNL